MFAQSFSFPSILAFCIWIFLGCHSNVQANDENDDHDHETILEKLREYINKEKESFKQFFEKKLEKDEVRNWMNSFLYAKIRYGQKEKEQEFNVIFDSAYNLAQHPMNFVLYKCPDKDGKGKEKACKKHKMKIYKAQSENVEDNKVTTINGVQLNMKIVEDRMEYDGKSVEKAKLMLLDGTNFELFNPMLDSGAPGGPQMDGVFSLALGNKEYPSGMEQLLEGEKEQIVTVYMQPFQDLDFFSKTTAKVSIGKPSGHCNYRELPNWLDIVEPEERKWKIGMEVTMKNNNKTVKSLKKQQVLISTMDSFIFAPKSVTELLKPYFTYVKDSKLLKKIRELLKKPGLEPKDVLIICPKQEEKEKMPTFEFKFGNQTFTLTPDDYILKIVVPLDPLKGNHKIDILNLCHPMIRERPESGMYAKYVLPENNVDQWLFGQLFFNKACVTFKYGEKPQLALTPTQPMPMA